jgi:hypothetical protein
VANLSLRRFVLKYFAALLTGQMVRPSVGSWLLRKMMEQGLETYKKFIYCCSCGIDAAASGMLC